MRLLVDVVNGMRYLHASEVVHADIKPSNVLLSSKKVARARAKLADFGLAAAVRRGFTGLVFVLFSF